MTIAGLEIWRLVTCGNGLHHSSVYSIISIVFPVFFLSFVCLSACAVVCLFTCCLMANKDIYITASKLIKFLQNNPRLNSLDV